MAYRTVWFSGVGCLLIGVAISVRVAQASEAPFRPGDRVVTTEEAPLQVGTATLTTNAPGKEMVVTAVNGDWIFFLPIHPSTAIIDAPTRRSPCATREHAGPAMRDLRGACVFVFTVQHTGGGVRWDAHYFRPDKQLG